jgi:hypothetical protein
MGNLVFCILMYFCIFASQVGGGRTRPNTRPKIHTGIDLLFANVPENLRVPSISASSSDVPHWNKRAFNYFEVLFAFANANLHDDGVFVFAHATDPEVFRSIYNWAHTEEFYVAEDWFGMNDLDLQSPTNPSELVFPFCNHPFSFLPYFFLLCFPNSIVHLFLQTHKFFIKVFVRNKSFLNVRTSDFEDMGYNLKRDGWLNNFTDLKNQSMRDDGCLGEVLVKSAQSFSPSFSMHSLTRTTLYWIGSVTLVCYSSLVFFIYLFLIF